MINIFYIFLYYIKTMTNKWDDNMIEFGEYAKYYVGPKISQSSLIDNKIIKHELLTDDYNCNFHNSLKEHIIFDDTTDYDINIKYQQKNFKTLNYLLMTLYTFDSSDITNFLIGSTKDVPFLLFVYYSIIKIYFNLEEKIKFFDENKLYRDIYQSIDSHLIIKKHYQKQIY